MIERDDNIPEFPALYDELQFFKQYPKISELAAFERRLISAFDAADSEQATFEQLQAIPPEQWPAICFRFHASVQIFRCQERLTEFMSISPSQHTLLMVF